MKVFSRRRRWGLARGVFAACCMAASPALAQLTNDSVPAERTIPRHEEIEAEMGSRFHLGPVRLLPQITLNGPTYDNNVLGASGNDPKVSDWSLTVGAGLGVLIPIGKKVYLRGTALPQYIWYDRLEDRRQWGGIYGGSLYCFFNHLSLEADYLSQITPQYPNTEIQTQVLGDTRGGTLKLEVDLGGPWSVYSNGEYQEIEYRPLGAPPPVIGGLLAQLNRNEGAVRGGLRYKLTSYFNVGVGAEGTRTKFPDDPERADNESTAALVSVHYDRPRLFVNFNGGYRVGRAIDDSRFPEFSTFTGSGYVSYELIPRLDLNVYGLRGVEYGLTPDNPYYLGSLGGGGLTLHVGQRIEIFGYGGYGTNDYPVPIEGTGGVKRVDKVTTYGGRLSVVLYRSVSVTAQVSNTDYNSNIPAFDKTVFRFSSGFTVGLLTP
jgi:hypothetical protein